jgi:hypothetical protein
LGNGRSHLLRENPAQIKRTAPNLFPERFQRRRPRRHRSSGGQSPGPPGLAPNASAADKTTLAPAVT